MKKVLFMLMLLLLISGCGDKDMTNKEELDSVIASGNYIVLDVRTEDEYDDGHVVGAINIPYDEIDEDTVLDKNKVILVYCRSGNRSKIAYDALLNLGYQVYDLGAFSSIDLPKEF